MWKKSGITVHGRHRFSSADGASRWSAVLSKVVSLHLGAASAVSDLDSKSFVHPGKVVLDYFESAKQAF